MRAIDSIVIHCSATKEGVKFTATDIERWHRERGFRCIGYHFVIDINGRIEKGRPIEQMGGHCTGHNASSVGICYIGGLGTNLKPKDTRTPEQKESLLELVHDLMEKYGIDINNVFGHYQFAQKDCPCFKIETFKQEYYERYSK